MNAPAAAGGISSNKKQSIKAATAKAKAKQTITSLTTIIKKCRLGQQKKSVKNYIQNLIAKARKMVARGQKKRGRGWAEGQLEA